MTRGQLAERTRRSIGGDPHALAQLTQGLFDEAGMASISPSDTGGTNTGYGDALDPVRAAHCTIRNESQRTGALIRGLYQKVNELRQKYPNRPVRIAELGCGPLAPIALSVASLFQPEEVRLLLVDIHNESLAILERLSEKLKLKGHIETLEQGNLLVGNWGHLRPDIVVLEVMMAALLREPQGAVTAHLAPQFEPSTLWLPQKIEVTGSLFHGSETPASKWISLGPICSIDPHFRERAREGTPLQKLISVKRGFQLPEPLTRTQNLRLHTRVEVIPGIEIPLGSVITKDVISECNGRAQTGHRGIHVRYTMGADHVDFHSTES
ncbi:hypothetical protein IPG41_01395 [Candidatus Peregrinibacteria bacterium]|nr:MAG: hypothetical protein IPG41_01395 [Candidatus Peregrinibacteria bacterium]